MIVPAETRQTQQHTRTPSFEDYGSIISRVKQQVLLQINKSSFLCQSSVQAASPSVGCVSLSTQIQVDGASSKQPNCSVYTDHQAYTNTVKLISSDIESSDSEKDDLDWEDDCCSDAADEAILDFRTDLSPTLLKLQLPQSTSTSVLIMSEDTPMTDIKESSQLGNIQSKSSTVLETEFRDALKMSSMLVDYQEQYIRKRLATIREMGAYAHSAQHDLAAVLNETALEQKQSMFATINSVSTELDHTNEHVYTCSNKLVRQEKSKYMSDCSKTSEVDSILEFLDMSREKQSQTFQPPLELSKQSQKFVKFIPTVVPRLNL
ncbi:hypothetical protein O5D80_008378 [Batrachochytrium dendrobatidis]|nr:hypothetical protein O5D80_008378 [Batrachochytrium dendrobatidis]